jgi:hypothetical protein
MNRVKEDIKEEREQGKPQLSPNTNVPKPKRKTIILEDIISQPKDQENDSDEDEDDDRRLDIPITSTYDIPDK